MPETVPPQLHIAVCDDEPSDRRHIAGLTEEVLQDAGLSCAIFSYSDGRELLDAVRNGTSFHIFLLDVMMDAIGGMDLANLLRKLGDSAAIIFVSSNREMAMRGYEVAAARYLEKPVRRDRLQEALLFCYRTFCEKKALLLPTGRGRRRISCSEVVYAEAADRATRLILTGAREESVSMKFSDLAAMLPERQFVRSHRSYLVNLEHVSYVRNREVELTTGAVLPVSRYRLDELQRRMVDYLTG